MWEQVPTEALCLGLYCGNKQSMLTHCGLMIPYGNIDLAPSHYLNHCWLYLRTMLQCVTKLLFCIMSLKLTLSKIITTSCRGRRVSRIWWLWWNNINNKFAILSWCWWNFWRQPIRSTEFGHVTSPWRRGRSWPQFNVQENGSMKCH